MILDSLQSAERYFKMHQGFEAALLFLRSTDLTLFTSGRREIIQDKVFAVATVAPGVGVSGARLEAHRQFIDIQCGVAGIDNIGWKPLTKCYNTEKEYNKEKDVEFFNEVPDTWFGLIPGTFCIFFPEDAHAPLAVNGILHKVVVKVAIDF